MAAISQLVLYSMLLSTIRISTPINTLSPGQSIKDGETLVSNGEAFELGFFSPGSSSKRYLAIWYKFSTGTVVWVANRDSPISDFSGCLNLTKGGVLVLVNGRGQVVWQSITETTKAVKSPMSQLLDSGNLIIRDGNETEPENYLWQSFHFPGDTALPGMKIGRNLVTGQDWSLTSWNSLDDPAKGNYTFCIDPRGYPQGIMRRGNGIVHRQGSWNGLYFTGSHVMKPNPFFKYVFEMNQREVYYCVELLNNSLSITRLVVNASGLIERLIWDDQTYSWSHFHQLVVDQCDDYNFCGVNAKCNCGIYPICQCLEGFEPRDPIQWSNHEWSGGCVRNSSLSCATGEGFVMHMQMKLPDTSRSWFNMSLNLEECRKLCLKNCSCVAYANTDVRNGGSGCVLWFSDLIDMRVFDPGVNGQDLYVRMAASYIESIRRKEKSKKMKRTGVIVCSIIFGVGVLLLGWVAYTKIRKLKTQERIKMVLERDYRNQSQTKEIVDMELPIFDLATIAKATNQFSIDNKLGEGGFGPVYKGDLLNGQQIAVKRLSVKSGQGLEEFKNEVLLIAKLQHCNLIKLLGCCIQRDERMLIYEYMPNKSLDCLIFDPSLQKQLDWKKRMNIIVGIARGLLYLHQDSRLRIIHRDLKTSNVLLDDSMNPKISDFGMARIFGVDQIAAATNRVVGTYGYMAPEYAIDGFFSVKSDVFSFGVIVLEIVSGRRSKGCFTPQHHLNLVGYAWKLWVENRALELIDETLEMSGELSEIIRCIHISLLCVQQQPEERPNMSTVVLMLGGGSSLPQPKQHRFFTEEIFGPEHEFSSSIFISTSTNEIDTSVLYPR